MAANKLKCKNCKEEYPLEDLYACSACLAGLEISYDYSDLIIDNKTFDPGEMKRTIQAGPQNIWRYASFLPATPPPSARRQSSLSGLPVGCTPMVRADRLADRLGLDEVWIKNDCANPTHSFKDRVVAVAAARAREVGYKTLACASTGNLANSVAATAAALGLDSYVFVPADLEEEKIVASAIYGTRLVRVRGNYDDVNRLCLELSQEKDWAFVNVNLRPYYAEGSKTLAFEIAEQLGFCAPGAVVAPIASGSLYTKMHQGFQEWAQLNLIENDLPAMFGGQALGCSPVWQAYVDGHDYCDPVKPKTIAKSLAIGNPADGAAALSLARKSGGMISAVRDEEIRQAISLLAETTGIFTETAGGVTVATLKKLADQGQLQDKGSVVCVITGDGLKTPGAVKGAVTQFEIDPDYQSFVKTFALPV